MLLFTLYIECCNDTSCLRIPNRWRRKQWKQKQRDHHGAVGKLSSEQQIGGNKLLCSAIFRALHLAQPGLMAGWLASWLAGR